MFRRISLLAMLTLMVGMVSYGSRQVRKVVVGKLNP